MFIKPFWELSKKDADIAGGKGASLGEMINAGIPVPDGFVILSTTFDEFLHKSDLAQEIDAILESVDHKTISSVESASEKIQELIKHASMPEDIKAEIESQFTVLDSEFVAVRSSATAEDGADHAWAGQLESYLNTTQDTLLEKVQHCWASLFTPRAIFYRFEKGLDTTKISVAVVVQKMVNSEKSGIAFSVHPVTEDRNQIIIEAGFGLGEAIVSGSVTPDSYVVSKQPREIIDINVSNQTRAMYRKAGGGNEWLDIPEKGNTRVFADSEILALSEIIMTIENHYGFPCDIEWAYEDGKFHIVQSRPITTLSSRDRIVDEFELYMEDKNILNFSEWEYEFQQRNNHPLLAAEMWLRALSTTFKHEINLSIVDNVDYVFTSDHKGWVKSKVKKNIINEIQKQDLTYLDYISKTTQKRLIELENTKTYILEKYLVSARNELADLWKKFDQSFVNYIPWYYIPWYITEENILVNKLLEILSPFRNDLDKIASIQEVLGVVTFPKKKTGFQAAEDELIKIVNLSRENGIEAVQTKNAINNYCANFGYLSTFLFLDIYPKSYQEVVEDIKARLKALETENTKEHTKYDQILNVISKDQNVVDLVEFSQEYSWLLTSSVEESFKIVSDLQPFFRYIAKVIGIDYENFSHYLSSEIIEALENNKKVSDLEIDNRKIGIFVKSESGEFVKMSGPEAVKISKLVVDKIQGELNHSKDLISGKTAYGGLVWGIVKVCLNAQEAAKISEDDILVTSMTTPDFVPAMKKAAAIVTDEGGLLCHAAIICRELHKPCIINTKFATQILKDGDEVEVNANNGVVRVLSKEKEENFIDTFLSKVNKSDIYPFNGSFSPLLTLLAWSDTSLKGKYESSFPILMINKGRDTFTVISESEYKKPAKKVLSEVLNNNISIEGLKSEYLPLYEEANNKYDFVLNHEIQQLDENSLIQELKENRVLLSKIIARTLFIETLDFDILSHEVGSVSNLDNLWEKATHPYFESFELRRRNVIKKTIDQFGISDKSAQELAYIFTDYFKPKGINEIKELISIVVSKDSVEKENPEDFINWKKELSETENKIVDYIQYVMEARDVRKEPIAKIQYNLYVLAAALAERSEIPHDDIVYVTTYEYEKGVDWLKKNKSLIEKRKDGQILFLSEHEDIHSSLADYKVSVDYFMEKTESLDKDAKVFQGQSASKGQIKGTVRIILDAHNTNNVFNQGDILVTSMTRPEFVPLMKLAGAVVTNEGGITCHAAIISRELGIPCVIGTKFATQIFKDGDMVEVDADKGIVTKLS